MSAADARQPETAAHVTIVNTTCGLCGPASFRTEIELYAPVTDDEYDTAWEIAKTLHQIDRHLDDIAPEVAA